MLGRYGGTWGGFVAAVELGVGGGKMFVPLLAQNGRTEPMRELDMRLWLLEDSNIKWWLGGAGLDWVGLSIFAEQCTGPTCFCMC